jgi:hypothetical protein
MSIATVTKPIDTNIGDADQHEPGAGYTVRDLAKRWRVGVAKVLGFLRRGELVGINLAGNLAAKPQWRITPEAVAAFEKRRTSAPTPKARKQRRRPEVIDFFPG